MAPHRTFTTLAHVSAESENIDELLLAATGDENQPQFPHGNPNHPNPPHQQPRSNDPVVNGIHHHGHHPATHRTRGKPFTIIISQHYIPVDSATPSPWNFSILLHPATLPHASTLHPEPSAEESTLGSQGWDTANGKRRYERRETRNQTRESEKRETANDTRERGHENRH